MTVQGANRVTDESSVGVVGDESSFVDNSFLNTISERNQRYVGNDESAVKKLKKVAKLQHNPPKKRKPKTYNVGASDEEDDDNDDAYGGGRVGEDSDSAASVSSNEEGATRRSRRVTKGRRFAFWKGERPVYERGTMVDIAAAAVTPAKRGGRAKKVGGEAGGKKLMKGGKKVSARIFNDDEEDVGGDNIHNGGEEEEEEHQFEGQHQLGGGINKKRKLPVVNLPTDVDFVDLGVEGSSLLVWDDLMDTQTSRKVVSTAKHCKELALPQTATRPKGKDDKVGFAAHSFNIPETDGRMSGWISGHVKLPPGAIKDAEAVGQYSQVFFVSEAQDLAMELGIADPEVDVWNDHTAQRVLLSKGDSFYVPPGNIYRLENHSSVVPCVIFWTLIRPIEGGGGGVNGATHASAVAATEVTRHVVQRA